MKKILLCSIFLLSFIVQNLYASQNTYANGTYEVLGKCTDGGGRKIENFVINGPLIENTSNENTLELKMTGLVANENFYIQIGGDSSSKINGTSLPNGNLSITGTLPRLNLIPPMEDTGVGKTTVYLRLYGKNLGYFGGDTYCDLATATILYDTDCLISITGPTSPTGSTKFCSDSTGVFTVEVQKARMHTIVLDNTFEGAYVLETNGWNPVSKTGKIGPFSSGKANFSLSGYKSGTTISSITISGTLPGMGSTAVCTYKSKTPLIEIVDNTSSCSTLPPPPLDSEGDTIMSIAPTDFNPCAKLADADEQSNCNTCRASEGAYTAIGCIPLQPGQFVAALVRILLIVGIGVAFLLILYGSFLCLTSRGNPQQVQACRETITAAVVGIVLLIFALVIVRIIFGPTGILPGYITIFT